MKTNGFFYVSFLLASVGTLLFLAAKERASQSIVVQAVAVAVVMAFAVAGVYAFLKRFHRKKLLKFEMFSRIMDEERGGWLAGILTLLVTLAVSKWTFALFEYLVICQVYGHEAWVHGLRIAHKSILPNGDVLSGWPLITLNFGTAIPTVLIGFSSCCLFQYVGFRLQGRRLSDPKPKKKWKSSGESDSGK